MRREERAVTATDAGGRGFGRRAEAGQKGAEAVHGDLETAEGFLDIPGREQLERTEGGQLVNAWAIAAEE